MSSGRPNGGKNKYWTKEEKEKIQNFIKKLGINVSEELNIGKPEMYMKKHNIKID